MKSRIAKLLVTASITGVLMAATPALAQWAVFDAHNYAQNVLEAARALQQINNQIRQLQNQALMLQNMSLDLRSLGVSQLTSMLTDLGQVSSLMREAEGIAFDVKETERAFTSSYPSSYALATSDAKLADDAHQRWMDAMSAFRQTLTVQAQVAQNVQADSAKLSTLTSASDNAVGNLQVGQATNQLLALSVKQQLQIQNLMAAQNRAVALDEARRAEAEEQARAAFKNFLGSKNAYTPD